jgi:CRP-like cAMP-binding protein
MDGLPSLNRALVQIPGTALTMPARQLRLLAEKHDEFAIALNRYYRFLYAQAQQAAACNALHNIEARLSRWLLRTYDLCGSSFTVTQEALAAFMGVRRTSVSLAAHALQDAGIIRYRRGKIEILDLDRLRLTCCECHTALSAQFESLQAAPPRERLYSDRIA